MNPKSRLVFLFEDAAIMYPISTSKCLFLAITCVLAFSQYGCFQDTKPSNHRLPCESSKTRLELVEFISTDTIKVQYELDTLYKEIQYAGFRYWGDKNETKQYVAQSDTLTLIWYDDRGQFANDTTAINILTRDMGRYVNGYFGSPMTLEEIRPKVHDFIDLHGVSSTISRNGRTYSMFRGVNKFTDSLININYSGVAGNATLVNNFFCMLESMQFTKSERVIHE